MYCYVPDNMDPSRSHSPTQLAASFGVYKLDGEFVGADMIKIKIIIIIMGRKVLVELRPPIS